jgi:hypothetical protein
MSQFPDFANTVSIHFADKKCQLSFALANGTEITVPKALADG